MAERVAVQRPEPRTVEEARRAVAESRERMSDTLDAIEGRLIAKKQQLSDRMDIMRPVKRQVRSRPWPALAVAFGVGLVLWKLRHRGDHEEPPAESGRFARLRDLFHRT